MMDRHGLWRYPAERAIEAALGALYACHRVLKAHVNPADFDDLGGRSKPCRLDVDDSEQQTPSSGFIVPTA
jgi:hypothetical protein